MATRTRFEWLLAVYGCASLAFLTGCPSFATLKTARALDPGQLQVTEATEVLGMVAPPQKRLGMSAPTDDALGGVRPGVIIAGRYGVIPGLDVGFRVEPVAGFAGETTIQLARGKTADLALGPGAGYFQTPGPIAYGARTIEQLSTSPLYTVVTGTFPVLFGVNFGPGHQVVLAPRATWYFVQSANAGGAPRPGGVQTLLGGSLGVSFKTSKTLRVMPEIDVTGPVGWSGRSEATCTLGLGDCAPFDTGAVIVQGGLAFTVGADNLGP
jgi:hypothetical protein